MRKPTKKSMTKKLDILCSQIVRSRGMCERCFMKDYPKLQAAHIFSRIYRNTRWDCRDNILCLCISCHYWAHRNPILFTEWLQDVMGQRYDLLKIKHLKVKKWTLQEMINLYRKLEKDRMELP